MKFPRIQDIKNPRPGTNYLVPCLISNQGGKMHITPVIDHPHNDVENGQPLAHYHADFRFIRHTVEKSGVLPINKHSDHVYAADDRPLVGNGTIENYVLPMQTADHLNTTHLVNIKKSKLKHRCIHKGKCPHRGFDLSNENPKNGVITCPLHGLRFNAKTHKLLAHEN